MTRAPLLTVAGRGARLVDGQRECITPAKGPKGSPGFRSVFPVCDRKSALARRRRRFGAACFAATRALQEHPATNLLRKHPKSWTVRTGGAVDPSQLAYNSPAA